MWLMFLITKKERINYSFVVQYTLGCNDSTQCSGQLFCIVEIKLNCLKTV